MARKAKNGGTTATVDKTSPKRGEDPEEIAKLLKEIEQAEKEVQKAEIELDSRKEAAKSAKAEWLVKVAALRERVRTRERCAAEMKRQPLLNQKTLPEPKADLPPIPTELPEGAKSAKRIGVLLDIDDSAGKRIAAKGTVTIGYFDDKGECFIQTGTSRFFLKDKDFTEIVEPAAATPSKPAEGGEHWKLHKIAVLKPKLSEKAFDALESTHLATLGDLQAKMNVNGMHWAKDVGVHGRFATAIEDAFNEYLLGQA